LTYWDPLIQSSFEVSHGPIACDKDRSETVDVADIVDRAGLRDASVRAGELWLATLSRLSIKDQHRIQEGDQEALSQSSHRDRRL
jgi:hypothetical protein